MARDPLGERWPEVYREAPEVFDRFSRAEDRDGVIPVWLQGEMQAASRDLIEIGCGTGRWTRELSTSARTHLALEPRAGMLAIAAHHGAEKARWVRARGEALPCPRDSFDHAFAGFVIANLRPKARSKVLAEVRRVLKPGGSLWVLENHGDDGFDELRREAGLPTPRETGPLTDELHFKWVDSRTTRMSFEDKAAAKEILGTILGPRVHAWLEQHPVSELEHRISLLRWTPSAH